MPTHTFVYGKTGQGKTVGVTHKLADLGAFAESNGIDISIVRYSCAKDNTSYQVASNLVAELSGEKPRGYDKKTVFDFLYENLQAIGGTVIIVLDEIDSIGTDDDILYELPRARANGHLEDMWVSVIGISNDFEFRDNLNPKVKDTLCDEELHFAPYDASELRSILTRRAEKAFKPGVLSEDVIPLCAAMAARDKGSARQAIRYLYKAGELASNGGDETVTERHVREAEAAIERKSIERGIRDLTAQDHLALTAVVSLEVDGETPARTKQVYAEYADITTRLGSESIAMRRVRDHLKDLDLAGIVNTIERNEGIQGGQHYLFELNADLGVTIDILRENERLCDVMDHMTV